MGAIVMLYLSTMISEFQSIAGDDPTSVYSAGLQISILLGGTLTTLLLVGGLFGVMQYVRGLVKRHANWRDLAYRSATPPTPAQQEIGFGILAQLFMGVAVVYELHAADHSGNLLYKLLSAVMLALGLVALVMWLYSRAKLRTCAGPAGVQAIEDNAVEDNEKADSVMGVVVV